MSLRPIDDQLIKYLTDAHSIEEQAIAQMRAAPDLAGDPGLADAFRAHLTAPARPERLASATRAGRAGAATPAARRRPSSRTPSWRSAARASSCSPAASPT